MILLVGLGNPGPKYAYNRHNIGFMVVDTLHERYNFSPFKAKQDCLLSEGTIEGCKVYLAKPQSYMNVSGPPISRLVSFYQIPLRDVIVIHDDLDLKPWQLRFKEGGGSGGHNGLKSLDAHIGAGYKRLRVGIGHPGARELVSGYVLSNFDPLEVETLVKFMDVVAKEIPSLLKGDANLFITKVALRMSSPSSKTLPGDA